jgi:large subunit ribosomal protein L19
MSAGEETTATAATTATASVKTPTMTLEAALKAINSTQLRSGLPTIKIGDTVRVHAKIVEGTKERVQVFEGVVIKRARNNAADATFTVRKVSYNVGVERTFPLHSPRIDKVEIMTRARVRRARLFYLRPLRGKATRMKTLYQGSESDKGGTQAA